MQRAAPDPTGSDATGGGLQPRVGGDRRTDRYGMEPEDETFGAERPSGDGEATCTGHCRNQCWSNMHQQMCHAMVLTGPPP